MGLDNFWILDGDSPAFDPPLNLCGGMLSAHGEGSFRGKVYNDFFEDHVAGLSLYDEEICNFDLQYAADALEEVEWEEGFQEKYELTPEELHGLKRMFRAYADAGARLVSWY